MALLLTLEEQIARARADLRMGVPICLDGALVVSVETLSPSRFADFRSLDLSLTLALTSRRADTLRARAYDGDTARVVVPGDADLAWLQATADPSRDLSHPMRGPYQTLRAGDADIHRGAIVLCKQAHLLPAAMVIEGDGLEQIARESGFHHVPLAGLLSLAGEHSPLHCISSARVPLDVSKAGRVHVFRPRDGGEEHYAIEVGAPDRAKPVLSRLHSACFTGDIAGSLKCDCGPQLRAAMAQIGAEGGGVLLYLNQEGRGIGLANKMRAYSLQDQGFDTVEANHRLGFEDDERDFRIGAELLRSLGFRSVRLMTNNPGKVAMMNAAGVAVTERVALKVGLTPENAGYLATKAAKSGHYL